MIYLNELNKRKSILTNFLYKLFIVFLILFSLLILDKVNIINYKEIQDKLKYNINFPYIYNKFIGKKEEEKITNVMINDDDYLIIDENTKRYFINEDYNVYSKVKGYVYKIEYDNYYSLYIIDSNNIIYKYSYLKTINLTIYSSVDVNNIIGTCDKFYDLKVSDNYE